MSEQQGTGNEGQSVAVGTALGISLGVAIGAATDDMGMWIALGVAIGTGLGAAGIFAPRHSIASDETRLAHFAPWTNGN